MLYAMADLPESAQDAANNYVRTETDNNPWQQEVIDGFLHAGTEAWNHPVETGLTVTTGLTIGAIIQTGLNNAELMGGKVGLFAKIGKAAAIALPLGWAGIEIGTSDRPAYAAGQMIFDTGLFMGSAKLGGLLESAPPAAVTYPYAVSEVPKGLEFTFGKDGTVKWSGLDRDTEFAQVRLSNGQGFIVEGGSPSGTSKLFAMPDEVDGVGQLQYGLRSTTLKTELGDFSRDVGSRVTYTPYEFNGANRLETNGVSVRMEKPGESFAWLNDGRVKVYQGDWRSGIDWNFNPDGSLFAKATPRSDFRLDLGADGNGAYTRIAARVRAAQGGPELSDDDIIRVSLNPSGDGSVQALTLPIPDVTPPDLQLLASLKQAHGILDGIAPDASLAH